jgi:hypothetical protein
MELPFWGNKPDNHVGDEAAREVPEKPNKERKNGRPKLPGHLQRVPAKRLEPAEQRTFSRPQRWQDRKSSRLS